MRLRADMAERLSVRGAQRFMATLLMRAIITFSSVLLSGSRTLNPR